MKGIEAMHRQFGRFDDQRCKDCRHLISGEYHDRIYHKCELYGMSHSAATDWRLSYPSCGMYNMHVKRSTWVPIFDRINHSPKAQEPPLDGQIRMEGL